VLLLCALIIGCQATGAQRAHTENAPNASGLVVVLSGIEGPGPFTKGITEGLKAGGVEWTIQVYDWSVGSPMGWPVHLADLQRNLTYARRLARLLGQYRREHPDAPIYIIGHSGGGGLGVMALEALAADVQIDGAVLLAPALSPTYDLRPAMRHVSRAIYNYHSRLDLGFLKAGTTVFGTVDRVHSAAAGAVGFTVPPGLSPPDQQLYADKLRQIPWTTDMRQAGHYGGHLGWAGQRFIKTYLAPLLLGTASDPESPLTPQPTSQPHKPRRDA
jgi:pimeloyl-ACP methyl ester carboxylesterase